MREELKQAAAKRRDTLTATASALSECERVLLRAAAASPGDSARNALQRSIGERPELFAELGIRSLLEKLLERGAADAIQAGDEAERKLLAQVLFSETQPPSAEEIHAAILPLQHSHLSRRQRGLRNAIGEAERKGDWGQVASLTAEKLALDRELRDIEQ